MTRREIIALGGLALGAVAFGSCSRERGEAGPDDPPLRKAISLNPAGCIHPGSPQDLRFGRNRHWIADSGTPWLHLWADWPALEPAPGRFDERKLAEFDEQVDLARGDGNEILMTLYRFPGWANGTGDLTTEQRSAAPRELGFRWPEDVSVRSPWGTWVGTILRRYAGRVDIVQICNEPNYQMWPQRIDDRLVVDDVVARMFVTAQEIQTRIGPSAPLIAGPGSADESEGSEIQTAYDEFTRRLLARLDERGFRPGRRFAWAHHNYNDITHDRGPDSTAPDAASEPSRLTNSAAAVRRLLVDRWAGWPDGDAARPQVLLTEGGATLPKIESVWGISDPQRVREKQAELIRRGWERMADRSADGAGIAMFSQYMLHTEPHYDSGLCELPEAGGEPRPAYWAWKALPAHG